ncbi:MAG: hypothetical protein P1P84_03465 [Deferrisomatales bacterium]|nr:hypothetical protein [Deferrisomatales bacterium]
MSEQPTLSGAPTGADPTPQELEEILAKLEFFLHMDEADVLPLEEEAEDGDEK